MPRRVNAPDTEPTESNFPIPSEKEHLLQIADYEVVNKDIISVKLEVVGGDEAGRTMLHRVNTNDQEKSFYYCRMFLKAIAEPYKGEFEIDESNWQGKQFYATVKHSPSKDKSKMYANINEYNFEKMVEQVDTKPDTVKPVDKEVAWDE